MDLHQPVDSNKTYSELTAEEIMRLEHQKLHEKHKGHDAMHTEMVFILLITMLVAQILLVEWKRRHYRSYSMVTLVGMWVIPVAISLKNFWFRFILIWSIFTLITLYIGRKTLEKPIDGKTPRIVYKWFYLLHKASCVLGIVGYIIMMLTFFGLNLVFGHKPHIWMDTAVLFFFYGLYYGVLSRDIAEICSDKMAFHIGYYRAQGMPTRQLEHDVCAVCGNKLLVPIGEQGVIENTYKLSCGHVFHEFCIRGWCIVGKKQTCPYCKEKVDLKAMFKHLWERPHVLYGQLLDWIRLLVAWQPLILCLVQGINWMLGLE